MATPAQKLRYATLHESLIDCLVPWVEQHEATNNEVIAVIVGAAMRGMLDAGMSPDEVRGAMEKLLVASIGTNASEQREGVNTRAPDAITGGN